MRGLFEAAERALRRCPIGVAAGLMAVAAVLADVHVTLLRHWHESGREEWPQWWARTTVMAYWWLLPLTLLVVWAHRRAAQGRLGAVAAALLAVGMVSQVVITLATVVWGAALGRGDLPSGFAALEAFGILAYLGLLLTGVAWLRDRALPRLWGVLLLAGFVVDFGFTGALAVTYVVLAVLVIGRTRRVVPVPAGVPAVSPAE